MKTSTNVSRRREESERTAAKGGRPRSEQLHQAILQAAVHLVLTSGFRSLSMDAIAAEAGVGRMTIYRRWPNKAAIIMAAFVMRVDPGTLFKPADNFIESIRLQMRTMAKAFRGRDGALIRVLLAEAQFDPELAKALREQWTLPRRKMAAEYFRSGIRDGILRADIDPEAMIDILYAPLYYRLQMGVGALSDAYVDEVFEHAMKGLLHGTK
ncbi:AcrR family transcriptional regulator [Silvibacterium bohemicum]|uniref:AcrR family transcriptional regulator n=1 Tax=Silvibacterium bohemicum TaxID=1577686 RepID=A0A841JRA5_9BACT|nr:TetR/AcrR family transcriptional regulator [Silvibacterium bohemicum]MBB6142309.1 AcrR family transcriptional regulator [Silvibacterium bohemicum]